MKHIFIRLIVLLVAVVLYSCDSGDIYPKEESENQMDVDVTGVFHFTGLETFPENYNLVFGAFKDDSPYPISAKQLSKPSSSGDITVSLTGIPQDATYIGLYLVQQHSNTKMHSFFRYDLDKTPTEDIEIPPQEINLAVFGRIQKQVFAQCLQCHGGSGFAAAGLHLTEGKSYSDLVNIEAIHNTAKMRIAPNNLSGSYLIDVLKGEVLQNQHSSLSSLKEDDIELIKQWVLKGAENN